MRQFILIVEFIAAVLFLGSLLSMCAPSSGPPAPQPTYQQPAPPPQRCCDAYTCWC